MTENTDTALRYWRVGFQYLDLAEKVSIEIASQGNKWMTIRDGIDLDMGDKKHDEETKWSDHNLGIPVIFNFYHGLELSLKGLIAVEGEEMGKHNLSNLLKTSIRIHGQHYIFDIMSKYLSQKTLPIILKDFFSNSSSPVDLWYQALKYPESLKGQAFTHSDLMYKQGQGANFYKELSNDIHDLRVLLVKHIRSRYPQI